MDDNTTDTDAPVFYQLPARLVEEGMSTADGQDVISAGADPDGTVWLRVYTPRSDDAELDAQNRCEPETRMFEPGSFVNLAVFADTDIDGRADE